MIDCRSSIENSGDQGQVLPCNMQYTPAVLFLLVLSLAKACIHKYVMERPDPWPSKVLSKSSLELLDL